MKLNITASLVTIATAATLIFTACKKDKTSTTTDTVTEDDIAEMTADAVTPTDGGYVNQVNSSIAVYNNSIINCGIEKDSTIAQTGTNYQYSLYWKYVLSCTALVPSTLTMNFNGSHSYTTTRMTSADSCTGQFTLTGLQPSASNYTLSSSYIRNGSQVSKIGRNYSFTSKITITSSNVLIDKTTYKILSGTANVTITGASTSGNTFSFSGTLTFQGNNTAVLVVNGGSSHTINW